MERALVVGASGGIGAAVAAALAARGVAVTGLSQRIDGLDVTDEASVARVLGALTAPVDLVFVATGALAPPGMGPEKALRAIDPAQVAAQFALNALGPMLVLKHVRHLMPRDRRAVFAALSARVGSIGDNALGGWYSYRASKAALNQMLRTASVEMARSHRQAVVVALHPGTVDTGFGAEFHAGRATITPGECASRLLAVIDTLTPADTGSFRDHLGAVVPW
jgi:NAD(P)-dependent dehydrogenase (short-subunit alcohol dehydrogenase family)